MRPTTLSGHKAQAHECVVINYGQPKHRYAQQAVPARYGTLTVIYFNKFIIYIIMI